MMLTEISPMQVNSCETTSSGSTEVKQFSSQSKKNDLIYVCELDSSNKLNCHWIQGCLI
jgi:hypothetical protein